MTVIMIQSIKLIRDSLARHKVKDFEIYFKRSTGHSVEARDGKAFSVEGEASVGFGLRVIVGGKLGFAYGTDFSTEGIRIVVSQAVAMAAWGPDFHSSLLAPAASALPSLIPADSHFSKLSSQDRLALAVELEAEVLRNKRVKYARYATYGDSYDEIHLINSLGLDVHYASTGFSLMVNAIAEEGGMSETGDSFFYSPVFSDLNPVLTAREAAGKAVALLGGRRIPNYSGPLILDRFVVSEILEVLSPSFTAENVAKNNSFVTGKKGKKLYSEKVSLIDDGLWPKGVRTQPVDDEGSASQTTPLVDKGRVVGLLYDRTWAQKEGVSSTGNSFRENVLSLPRLSAGNFYLKPGHLSLAKMFQQVGDALYVTGAIGMHTAEPISGDLSVGVTGFCIRNGLACEPFRSVALTSNLHQLLADVVEVADDLRFFSSHGAPSLLIKNVSVSGES